MGMFDWYEPKPRRVCPICGTKLVEWQGKDGPCLLFRWKQGFRNPVNQADWLTRKLNTLKQFLLPEKFELYSYNCEKHQPITALGQTSRGVWKTTKIMGHGRFDKSLGRLEWKPYSSIDKGFGILKGGKKSLTKALLEERRKDRIVEEKKIKRWTRH